MDPKFLEFWGSVLLDAARGQQQISQLTEGFQRGLKDFGELARRFAKIYGLPQPEALEPDTTDTWQAAERQFQHAFKQFLNMLDVVPRSEYRMLLEKNAALQTHAAEQQEIIDDLKQRLTMRGACAPEVTHDFEKLMQQQRHQFQEVMQNFSDFLGQNTADKDQT